MKNNLHEEYINNLTVFHGSPYDFIKFEIKNIGSGEGNQSFGYGLYFTSNKEVARYYSTFNSTKGYIYTVKIKDGLFIDWYKKIDENIKQIIIQELIKKGFNQIPTRRILTPNGIETQMEDIETAFDKLPNGKFIYENLKLLFKTEQKVSHFLKEIGINGIKYEVDSLRKKREFDGINYVIFDSNDITIVQKEINLKKITTDRILENMSKIQLTEAELTNIIANSVNKIIKENTELSQCQPILQQIMDSCQEIIKICGENSALSSWANQTYNKASQLADPKEDDYNPFDFDNYDYNLWSK